MPVPRSILAASYFTEYDWRYLVVNAPNYVLIGIVPKIPEMHRVRHTRGHAMQRHIHCIIEREKGEAEGMFPSSPKLCIFAVLEAHRLEPLNKGIRGIVSFYEVTLFALVGS